MSETQEQFAAELAAEATIIDAVLTNVAALEKHLADLEAALANSNNISPVVADAFTALKAKIALLQQQVPAAVAPAVVPAAPETPAPVAP